jgi:hypothetical protein
LSLANAFEVACLVTSSLKFFSLDKGFDKMNGMAVFDLPIAVQTPEDAAQDMAGQMGDPADPRQY